MTFSRNGSLYISDSFQGAIFRIDKVATCAKPCVVATVAHDPLLATAGFPPFGANGLALNADETALFIANTGDNRVLKMDLANKSISVFSESLHGADGITFDDSGRLWVAANQGDQIVALSETGRVIAKLGEFQGINRDGTPNGLLFPASPVIVASQLPDNHPSKKLAQEYVQMYEAANGPGTVAAFGSYAWDACLELAHAIPLALKTAQPGTKEFRRALRDALEGIKELGVTNGAVNMSKTDHLGLDARARVMVQIKDGKWVLQP